MTFTVTIQGFCRGGEGEHVLATVHVTSPVQADYPLVVTRDDLSLELGDYETMRDIVIQRIKSCVLELGPATWLQRKAAVEAATFKV